MLSDYLKDYIKLRASIKVSTLSKSQINLLEDFVDFLDVQRSRTLRAAVAPKQTCPSCSGAGYWIDTTNLHVQCRQCKGTGQV